MNLITSALLGLPVVMAALHLGIGCSARAAATKEDAQPRPFEPVAQSPGNLDEFLPLLPKSGGICVVAGEKGLATALDLARNGKWTVFLQLQDPKAIDRARSAADAVGLYGTRLYVDEGPASHLLLADNVADALISFAPANLPVDEARRVLHPGGLAWMAGTSFVKESPAGADNWSHPYHGPDNNPVSQDRLAVGPYLTQFLADPRYAPLPQVAVAAGGRIFKAFGHIAFKEREEPWLNTLAAFNGYNGTLLWRREIPAALMVHRSTLIATATEVFFGDDASCKVLDAATGELRREIKADDGKGGSFWKWMALDRGVLYAVIGGPEDRDPVIRSRSMGHGWPWDPLSPGFNRPEHTWGFGRTLVAISADTGKVLWRREETDAMDTRAVCMSEGRIYSFRYGSYLNCIDAQTGQVLWRKTKENADELFYALGEYSRRQDWRTNWRTTAYLKASGQALYFAGPPINKLLALSAKDGSILWQHPYDNYQLILRPDGLFGLPGQIDKDPTRRFDPLTGKILEEIAMGRRACTRPTSSLDAIFCRADEGSARYEVKSSSQQLVSPMRPNCQDGVTIANGLLYWWPSVCDCNLTLYGITALGPAGNFQFGRQAVESERLQTGTAPLSSPTAPQTPSDWPVFRGNARATATADVSVCEKTTQAWSFQVPANVTPTPPTAVADQVFFSGDDGIVRAVDARSGKIRWKAFTGGSVRYPPTIANGRAYVGSGDGYIYAFDAADGRLAWRFRAAPVERRIPVYGSIQSTWPAAGGVLVHEGVAYAAAGIVNYDGTHVYALDAATGKLRWQNNSSGHIDPAQRTGISAQGHLLWLDSKVYMPGGNAVSPAIYDAVTGACLSDPKLVRQRAHNNVLAATSPRGSDLYVVAGQVRVSGKPLYAHPKYPVQDGSVLENTLVTHAGKRTLAWINKERLAAFAGIDADLDKKLLAAWGKSRFQGFKSAWDYQARGSTAIAVGNNAVILALPEEIVALRLSDGAVLWRERLPAPVIPWGLALDRAGSVFAALGNAQILCWARPEP